MNKIKMSKQGLEKLATDVFGAEKDENLDLFYDIYEEEIIDINFPLEGVFESAVIVSIDKKHPGQAKKVIEEI